MDHMGGLLSLIERLPPACLWWNALEMNSPFLNQILSAASTSGTRVLRADRTCPAVQFGEATFRFLNLSGGSTSRILSHREVNNASVVLRLDYREVSFLFTGDIQREAEEELVNAGVPLRASVLKVAHHGCTRSTTNRFVEAVRPRVAVISCDDSPAGTCPDRKVWERLRSVGAEVLWTGRHGAVTIETDGQRIVVRTGRETATQREIGKGIQEWIPE
jgi:competence protein ComEC